MTPERVEYAAPGPGQCILHNIGGRLHLQRADPVVALSAALIAQIRAGTAHPDLTLDGQVLVIDAVNEQARYRLATSPHAGYVLGLLC
jgi:hypothetical protein